MKLEELTEALELLVLDKAIRETEEYQGYANKTHSASKELENTIEKVPDLELRKKLQELFNEYQDIEGNRSGFQTLFAFKRGAIVGEAFQILKKI